MLSVPRAPDPHRLLLRALLAEHPDAALLRSASTPWASATFVGARHTLALRFADADAAQAAANRLPDLGFVLRRHLVADIVGTACGDRLDIETLTVEEH